jgi:hypothetical protein
VTPIFVNFGIYGIIFPKMILFSILVVHITSKPLVPSISSSYAFVFLNANGVGFSKKNFLLGVGAGEREGMVIDLF